MVCTYFSSIFSSSSPSVEDIEKATEGLGIKVDLHMKEILDAHFSCEEIRGDVFDLGSIKALGLDGFHAVFFQKFWSIVGLDVSNTCLKILNGEGSIKDFNSTYVVLVPKSKNPYFMKDFIQGTYNVKSGYKVAVGLKVRDVSSGSSQNGGWWKTLWNLIVPPKVKIFLWKVCNEAIISLSNLFRRKVPLNPCCVHCVVKLEDLNMLAMIAWGILTNRNLLVHDKARKGSDELVSWVTNMLAEFQNSRIALIAPHLACPPIKEAWQDPAPETLKLNTDIAVFQGRDVFGIGVVIRNDKEKVILTLSKLATSCFSVQVCEAITFREGLWLANQHGLKVDWAEVDAANVAASVRCFKPTNNCASFVFDDIFGLCKDVGLSECQAISRCGNGVAHNLASLDVSSLRDNLWQGYCHSVLVS
ncbi:hypothetical protein Dsin_000263 [Dipteronia sinensis]|uniref:Reverse transcriptase zinc-binding domain-containing protein n=1 Tax=Dipteronia sinensis TaxID=43782 RepID=A0AAE0EHW3_9ROSI|nr:hypothetical protein Dsin_000263 [Dipteronia sinensis]